ncbi:uncharacterized protein LOC108039773 [Drosophila rhopaloa]|uniref:Uncharacterized protein n=1 Tax=Drosophila rhopaloa TaxID=1041015 RepID=A0ABM5J455_DRORH|nr:uncharacterized protein LOC108039773 [Drosophila rhopaloa]
MDYGLEPKVANLLPYLLDNLHELHIVFLSMEEPVFPKEDLYTYCFKNGFVNVILIFGKDLYSYLPYPSIQPIKLLNITKYINTRRTIRNFQGYPIRTLRSKLAPRDFEYFNDRNELVRGGYLFTAIKEFSYRYNATIESVPVPEVSENASYGVIFEMMIAKNVDIVCYFTPVVFWNSVPHTAPISIVTEYFIVPHARPISSYLYYSRPFRWTLWLVVALTVIYGSLMLYLISGRARNEIGECLLYSLSHILYNGQQTIRIADWREIVIHVILTIGGFVLTNVYLATLSSILTSGLYEEEYKTLNDLAKAPYPSLHDDFYRIQLEAKTFLPEAVRRNSMTLNASLLIPYRDGLNKNYMYLLYEDRLELILMQQYLLKTPRFNMIRQGVGYALETYCVSKSLPYLEMTSEFMRRLHEHGINIKMKADTFRELIQLEVYTLMRDDEPQAKAFDLEFYYFAFGLWITLVFIKMLSFLLASVFILAIGAPNSESTQVLYELNRALRTELNVFIDFDDSGSSYTLHSLDTPRIQLTSKFEESTNLRIRGNFTENALIIVKLLDYGLDPMVANLLPSLLDKLHELNIVFLSMEEPVFPKEDLYTYCFKNGFVNVILIYGMDLYSYLPYPSIQPIKLSNISEYLNRRRIIRKFQGYPIRSLRTKLAPRDFEYFNDRNELVRGGYLFTALKEFSYRYNATIESVPVPRVSENASYDAVVDMLTAKNVDIICYLTPFGLWERVAHTEPLSIVTQYFIVPHARPISSYLYYSRPFKWTLWLVVALTVFYGSLMLYLISGRARNEIGECLLYSLSHILYNGQETIRIAGWREIVVHVILTIGGFVLTNVYLATLSSILTSGLYEEEYKTLNDLAKAPYPTLLDDYYRIELQAKDFIPEAVRRNSITLNSSLLIAYRDALNEDYMYSLYEDRLELILMQQYLLKTPRFNMIRQGVGYALETYCVSKSLPYLEMTSEFMRRLHEHGINIKMKGDTFRELIQLGVYTLMRDDEPPTKPFDLQFYYFAFGLWAVGLSVSVVVFFTEVVRSRFCSNIS